MPFEIIRNDISKMKVDAIVNSAHPTPAVGGGVDAAIHQAAGPELLEAYRRHGPIARGAAFVTPGFGLFAKHVIHTVGPVWEGGGHGERSVLRSCYETCLSLAAECGAETVAFPLISAGVFGFPREEAFSIAVAAISAYVLQSDLTVYLVVYDPKSYALSSKLVAKVESYISDLEVESSLARIRLRYEHRPHFFEERESTQNMKRMPPPRSLSDLTRQLDETFAQMLLRLIDERGKTDVEVYKKANIDKKHFAKIRADVHYQPKKPTVFAFAMALSLSVDETKDLLMRAGYALSHSFAFDILCESFLRNKNYDIFELNQVLFDLDLPLVGSMS